MSDIKLKSCPYCNGQAEMGYEDAYYFVYCTHCDVCGASMEDSGADAEEQAAEEWNAMPRHLQWTSELPALMKFGYYWWKKERNVVPCIVYVTPVTSTRPLEDGEEDHPEVFFFSRSTPLDARTLGGYWAGPIAEPMEEK